MESLAWALVSWLAWGVAEVGAAPPLEWQTAPGYRWRAAEPGGSGSAGFTLLPATVTGVAFTNHLAETTVAITRILENGSGVALGDVDGDGWCDLYFCRLEGPNVLYRNLGDFRFEDITDAAGVACPDQYSTGAAFADIDGDGDLDLLVNAIGGGTRAFLNDGQGHFQEITNSRLVRGFGATSLALADIDDDGDLDLYVTNYRTTSFKDRPPGLNVQVKRVDGRIVVTPEDRFIPAAVRAEGVEIIEKGERDFLYLNDGRGRFAPVSWTSGAIRDEDGQPLKAPPLDWGLTVVFRDLNGDLAPDLYICNDFFHSPDRIWIHQPGKGFQAIDRLAIRNVCVSSMGMDFADFNRDGDDDFIVTDMVSRHHAWRQRQRPDLMKGSVIQPVGDPAFRPEVPRNTLHLSRGDGTYAEIAQLSGVDFSEWSWSAVCLDVDLDGYEDILIPTGNNHDVQDADALRAVKRSRADDTLEARLGGWRLFPPLLTPILAFRNNHDLTFTEMGANWGLTSLGTSQGLALADLDNDGDLDLVVNRLNGAAEIYRNNAAAPRVLVRLKGTPPNTFGVGAKLRVLGGPVTQSQEVICGGRYLSCDDPARAFAAGTMTNRLSLEVTWRDHKRSRIEGVAPNRVYEISEAGARDFSEPLTPPNAAPFFEDASALIRHTHVDEPFDDFARQPLLSRRFSQLGPGVAWLDWDGDGSEDLAIGAGRGGRLALYRNLGRDGFVPLTNATLAPALTRDLTAMLSQPLPSGKAAVLAGVSNYEDERADGATALRYAPATDSWTDLLPGQKDSVGPLALGDLEGNGGLDLFVGSRIVPGRYPAAAPSQLYRDRGGKLVLDLANSRVLRNAGLVSGAVFSDVDGDGDVDLVLACEWGPVRVYRNDRGALAEVTQELGLAGHTGWWTGVTTGDLDGDGRLEIVALNWGRNTRFQRHLAQPLRVYYGELGGVGSGELIEAYYDPEQAKWVPWRDYETMLQSFPSLAEKCPTFRAYGEVSVDEVIGTQAASARRWEATTLDSTVFWNRGGRFVAQPLPIEAQFAPGFGVCVTDFDGDGREDVFISQNFFDVEPETSRYDAGLGLWLRGDGRGGLTALSASESGVRVYGQQRGCAVADYDGDGRVDLVVTQNRGETKLYHNVKGKAGLRVRLAGPARNPSGVGASVRLKFGERFGPAREVHGGSGYWSQDSTVLVLGQPEPASEVWVRWPGGQVTTAAIPAGSREIRVGLAGSAERVR